MMLEGVSSSRGTAGDGNDRARCDEVRCHRGAGPCPSASAAHPQPTFRCRRPPSLTLCQIYLSVSPPTGNSEEARDFFDERGCDGFFLWHGQIVPIGRYQQNVHQNVQRLHEQQNIRPSYVNNFIFVHRSTSTTMNAFLITRLPET
jgi:hypothetical protein